ncbi:MAG: DUF2911 domain-containing protein [Acidobacteriota bacterium]
MPRTRNHRPQQRLDRLTLSALVGGLFVALALPVAAQQTVQGLPRVSPHAAVTQTVGIAELTVDYHRPGVNDRDVWGVLVPWDQVWRAGANENTTFATSHDVTVAGKALPAGVYGLHLIPRQDAAWTVIFSHDHQAWGSFAYDETRDALRVDVAAQGAPFEERLAYRFDEPTTTSATLVLHWADMALPIAIEADTVTHALAHIEQQLTGLPQFFWQGWNSAANYCVQSGTDDPRCLEWAERSISNTRQFQNLMTKAALLRQQGDEATAAALEKEAIPMGTEAQINALGYQHLYQRQDVEAALALFRKNVDEHPDSWNVHDSLGEALAAQGDTNAAIKSYEKALSMAPENQHGRIEGLLQGLRGDA